MALELRQLPMHAHRLQAHAADAMLFVGRLLVHDVVLDAVEFVAEPFGHAADGVGELVDDGVEKRHRGRKALAAFDGAPVGLDRMHRLLARGDQHALGHDEAQPHQVVARLRQFLMQIGHHADDLVAENVEPQMLVGAGEHLARRVPTAARAARSRCGSDCRRAPDAPRSSRRRGRRARRRPVVAATCSALPSALKAIGPDDAGRRHRRDR